MTMKSEPRSAATDTAGRLYLARVPRLVAAAPPAMIIGAAIVLRPDDRVRRSEAAR